MAWNSPRPIVPEEAQAKTGSKDSNFDFGSATSRVTHSSTQRNTKQSDFPMDKIINGVSQFRREHYLQNQARFEELAAKKQKPIALFITCADSRIDPNLITETEPGDLFLIRNAGNIVPPHGSPIGGESATIEYSVEVLGIRNIIICGHSQCGAMKAILDSQQSRRPAGGQRLVQQRRSDAADRAAEVPRPVGRRPDRRRHRRKRARADEQPQHAPLRRGPTVVGRAAGLRLVLRHRRGRVLQFDQREGRFVDLNGEVHAAAPLPIRSTMRGRPTSSSRGRRPRYAARQPVRREIRHGSCNMPSPSKTSRNLMLHWSETWRQDFLSSLVVFLVALPLCMGIALACGAPVAAGLVTGIIGGHRRRLSGRRAAAGERSRRRADGDLRRSHSRARHGGAGHRRADRRLFQLIAGLLKLGQWFRAVSPAVIHGMLSGHRRAHSVEPDSRHGR